MGLTNEQMAERLSIAVSTLYKWKDENMEFSEAIKKGSEISNARVKASLYQRATGYSHPAVKIFYDSRAGRTVRAEYTEHFPPDTAAAFIWLKNREPEEWRDRREYTFDGDKPPVVINSNTAPALLDPSQQDNIEIGEGE